MLKIKIMKRGRNNLLNRYDNLAQAHYDLSQKGFSVEFQFQEQGLKNKNNGKVYTAEEMEIEEYHRFEGSTVPDNSAMIFAISCMDQTKGTLVTPYNMYSDPDLIRLLQRIRIAIRK